MLEQQRIEYLQAMGIQLWMPRQALDNAAESNWLAGAQADNAQPETAGSGSQVKAGHAADLLAGMGLGDVAKPPTNVQPSEAINSKPEAATTKPELNQVNPAENIAESDTVSGGDVLPVDLTVPKFELHFALWPCGILWVSGSAFEQQDQAFQTAVSYSLLGNTVPQASYSQFKWPYIEGSHEDQSMAVALRALTAQWEFMSSQGARGWVATDSSSLQWLGKVASKALYAVDERSDLYSVAGKRQLWLALQTLLKNSVL